ncbi:MAG TPA: TetR/AcrR family transcriptional regulator [Pyrinomonadaceae bacterium]|nr:TetR/AcrR family transcriptional regulator [Pyrinomonadaceae bacterium]
MAKNGTQKSQEKAQEIYLRAAQIFFAKGYNACSLNDIAEALNITKAGLYYYVESKQSLLFEIINLGLDSVDNEVLEPARSISDAETRLKFIISNHARLCAGGNHAVIIISHETNELNFYQREAVLKRRRDYFDFIRNTMIELQTQGKLYDVDITTATFTILGMILWLSRWYRPNGTMSVEKVCEDVCEMALRGLLKGKV